RKETANSAPGSLPSPRSSILDENVWRSPESRLRRTGEASLFPWCSHAALVQNLGWTAPGGYADWLWAQTVQGRCDLVKDHLQGGAGQRRRAPVVSHR